ncbi:protein lin-41-like [Saccostrea cucullata]|uniref:protein lin-41-like n=1 Tax=Saccostrea cuccullata TaxID=36930 RepID=UPI002ED1263D
MVSVRVVRYSSSGRKTHEFQTDQNGEGLFLDPRFVCENINEDICISDCNTCGNSKVVVLSKAGNLRFTYDGKCEAGALKYFFQPLAVTTDSLGHILIADKANDAVHLISQDGIFLSVILTENDGISVLFESL